ncbi:class I SAM-dependent methyltransferase [Paenibacillus sp. JCM 10914]|uniref:methyltransferase domain-containing protein n=1 Tax=Paenibacillus sp. JCM 10914 TaxID=1236974 RepID=UPI0003CC95D9|nr:methyltransferase domain-containing protein [Paenibacillus sp. JCM 10914]GAE06848.1 methyltransferase [Paenibacillus sp. JCM 10914]
MSEYYWDSKIEYLRNTRWLYYNDDYLEFLVQRVWKIEAPVRVVDYGCGYGYLGAKLLPLLPEGSSYTGIDKGRELLREAAELFGNTSYSTIFIQGDIEHMKPERQYDIAICHAFLLHMEQPIDILQRMIDSVVDGGRVICFEPHWIAGAANQEFGSFPHSDGVNLGVLQKLYELDANRNGRDGNIGMKLPLLMSQLGLRDVACRVSDKVNFLDQNMEASAKKRLFDALRDDGIGLEPPDENNMIDRLIERGLSEEEAQAQYAAELQLSQVVNEDSWLTYAPNMKISYGTVGERSL